MNHRNGYKKLNKSSESRRSMLKNMVNDLIRHGFMVTTSARAKALRSYAEKIITKAKNNENNLTVLRQFISLLQADSLKKLTQELAPKFKQRPGGYTRVIKLGLRKGDRAEMSRIEFVE